MGDVRCENCAWSRTFPKQGEEPKLLKTDSIKMLDIILEAQSWEVIHSRWRKNKHKHEQLVQCFRYPSEVMKCKSEMCGEFKAK